MSDQLRWTPFDANVLHDGECRQIDRRDGLTFLISHEGVAGKARRFFAGATSDHGQPGSQEHSPVMHGFFQCTVLGVRPLAIVQKQRAPTPEDLNGSTHQLTLCRGGKRKAAYGAPLRYWIGG